MLAWVHPWVLASHTLTYLLGLGAAHYLGVRINIPLAWLGWLWTVAVQAGMYLLAGLRTAASRAAPPQPERLQRERRAVAGAFLLLALAASLSVRLLQTGEISITVWLLMAFSLVLLGWYALPPWQGAHSGYGEILLSIFGSNLIPALAFSLQTGGLHRLLAMLTFALPLLHLASWLVLDLQSYARDVKYLRYTLLVRLGWERGLRVHNGLVIAALLVMGIALGSGLSPALGLPPLLSLVWGGFQIWYLERIREGTPPHWGLLRLSAVLTYLLPVGMTVFALWSR